MDTHFAKPVWLHDRHLSMLWLFIDVTVDWIRAGITLPLRIPYEDNYVYNNLHFRTLEFILTDRYCY